MTDKLGLDIDVQLAKFISRFLTTRLTDDKLKDKFTVCLSTKNCAGIVGCTEIKTEKPTSLKAQSQHRLIQGPVHPSFGLVKCTAGRVYPR